MERANTFNGMGCGTDSQLLSNVCWIDFVFKCSQWNSFRWRGIAVFQGIRAGETVVTLFVCLWLVQGYEFLLGL